MKLLYLLTLITLTTALYADDFQRRYGANSHQYDAPLYFTRNRHLPCSQPLRVQHIKKHNISRDADLNYTEDKSENNKISKFSKSSRTNALINEKATEMRAKQNALELERQRLEAELAELNTQP